MKNVAILGSGMAGCGAAYRLKQLGIPSIMYDQADHIGGHTASYEFPGGWLFDEGPHVSFTQDKRIQDLLSENIGGKYETLEYQSEQLLARSLGEASRTGESLRPPSGSHCQRDQGFRGDEQKQHGEIANYEQWLRASFGDYFAENFPMDYTIKYHTTEAKNKSLDWIGPRLYQAKLEEVLRGALMPSTSDVHYISGFRYPSRGGFAAYLPPFAHRNERSPLEARALAPVHISHPTWTHPAGSAMARSSRTRPMRLDDRAAEIVPMIANAPQDVRDAAARLACTEVVIVCLGIDREDLCDAHWSYFYDRDAFFTAPIDTGAAVA